MALPPQSIEAEQELLPSLAFEAEFVRVRLVALPNLALNLVFEEGHPNPLLEAER